MRKRINKRNNNKCLPMILISLFFVGVFIVPSAVYAAPYEIPSDRRIQWEGNVGVKGGIPTNYTQAGATVQTSSQGDDTNAIRAALNAASSSQFVSLGAGTFTVTSQISIPSNVVLRGAGSDQTTIECNIGGSASEGGCISISGDAPWYPSPSIQWTSGYSKGDTQVTLSTTSGLNVGDALFLDVDDDNSFLIWECVTSCPSVAGTRGGNNRHMMQVVEVTGISGNTVTFEPPLYIDYAPHSGHSAHWPTNSISYSGLEDVNLELARMTGPKYGIKLSNGTNLWVKGVETDTANRAHIKTYQTVRAEVRDSYIHRGQSYGSVSYGVETQYTSGMLIENNVFDSLVASVVSNTAFSGSVVGYNYVNSIRYDNPTAWQTPGFGLHAAHAAANLFEGNIVPSIFTDNWWGSSSHTVMFRNRIPGRSGSKTQNTFAIGTYAHSLYNTYVGNVLGQDGYHNAFEYNTSQGCSTTTGIYSTGYTGNCQGSNQSGFDSDTFGTLLRHMNYDVVSNRIKKCGDTGEPGCQGGPTDTDLVDSLYYNSKPSWWDSNPWPPIGTDLNPMASSIPAATRFGYVGGPLPDPDPTPDPNPNPIPDPDPDPDPDPQDPPVDTPLVTAPTGLTLYPNGLNVVAIRSSDNGSGNVADNTTDNQITTMWSAYGLGQWIEFDLGTVKSISRAEISFYNGDQRNADFAIEVSEDRTSWTQVHSGRSSGNTYEQERFMFNSVVSARYVRIVGNGNSTNEWNSITEVDIF